MDTYNRQGNPPKAAGTGTSGDAYAPFVSKRKPRVTASAVIMLAVAAHLLLIALTFAFEAVYTRHSANSAIPLANIPYSELEYGKVYYVENAAISDSYAVKRESSVNTRTHTTISSSTTYYYLLQYADANRKTIVFSMQDPLHRITGDKLTKLTGYVKRVHEPADELRKLFLETSSDYPKADIYLELRALNMDQLLDDTLFPTPVVVGVTVFSGGIALLLICIALKKMYANR